VRLGVSVEEKAERIVHLVDARAADTGRDGAVEDEGDRPRLGRPVVRLHGAAFGVIPVRGWAVAQPAAAIVQPAHPSQHRMGLAERDEPGDEREQRAVGRLPVDPGDLVVLAVGVVVAALRAPEFVAVYEQRLAERIAESREGAQRGDLLDEELVAYLERATRQLLEGEGGEDLLATLRESNPGYELEEGEVRPELAINAPYPEDSPLSTVPPRLLQVYPALPQGFEYRFVACRVVVLERDARMILDYSDRCLW